MFKLTIPDYFLKTFWRTFFFNLKRAKQPLLSAAGCHTRPWKFKYKKKVCQTAITICRGLSHPTEWAALPPENIYDGFFKGGETL